MKDIILRFLFLVVIGELITLFYIHNNKNQTKVLAESTVSTITPSPTSTSEPTETPSPSPLVSPKPTAKAETPVPQPKFTSQQINEFIDRFASQYGVDPNVLRHIAVCESGFNQNAKSYIYKGLYQFGPITWRNLRLGMGASTDINLRLNAEEAVQTAAYALSHGKIGLWPNCKP